MACRMMFSKDKLILIKYIIVVKEIYYIFMVPTTPACTWWNRPEEDPSSGKLESTHPSRTSVKYDQVFFGVESIMRVNAASLDIRDATTSTPGTLNDLTTDLIMANNNNYIFIYNLFKYFRKKMAIRKWVYSCE